MTVLCAVAVIVLVLLSTDFYGAVTELIGRLAPLMASHPRWGLVLFLLFSALSAMLAFFSTALIVPAAIAAWGRLATVALLWIGWWLGAVASYLIGRYAGRPAARWIVDEERLRRFEAMVTHSLSLPRMILVQLALPSEIPGYVLGSLRYPATTYLCAVAIVELPFAAGVVYLGDRFLARDVFTLATVALFGLAATFIAGWVIHREPALRDMR